MDKTLKKHSYFFLVVIIFLIFGCSAIVEAATTNEKSTTTPFPGKITLSTDKGVVGTPVHFTIKGLEPNTETKLEWKTVEGKYDLNGLYEFTGVSFKDKVVPLTMGKSDANGQLEGDF